MSKATPSTSSVSLVTGGHGREAPRAPGSAQRLGPCGDRPTARDQCRDFRNEVTILTYSSARMSAAEQTIRNLAGLVRTTARLRIAAPWRRAT